MFILFNLLLHKVRSTYLFPHMFFPFSDMFFFISCSAAQLFFKALSQKMKNLFFFFWKREKKHVEREAYWEWCCHAPWTWNLTLLKVQAARSREELINPLHFCRSDKPNEREHFISQPNSKTACSPWVIN